MAKRRVCAVLPVLDGRVVQSIGFARYLPVGRADIAASFLARWGVDEIFLIDIEASRQGRRISSDLVCAVARDCFVPLAVGGGIRSEADVRDLLNAGADKVVINTGFLEQIERVSALAKVFGSQCLVASIDIVSSGRASSSDRWKVWNPLRRVATNTNAGAWAKQLVAAGAGELFIQDVLRDGSGQGFDLALFDALARQFSVPIIACGGAGQGDHIAALFTQTGVSAVAAGNMWHYGEHTVSQMKSLLLQRGIDVRSDGMPDYREYGWDERGRVAKLPENVLLARRFARYPKDVI